MADAASVCCCNRPPRVVHIVLMSLTKPPPPLTLSTVIGLLRRALFAWVGRGPLGVVVMVLISNRLGVVAGRLERMMVRFAAGRAMTRVSCPGVVAGSVAGIGDLGGGAGRRPSWRYWPARFGWLIEVKRHEAAWFTQSVDRILREPEMVGLLAASKEARRLLRPMCRMLGVDPGLLRPPACEAAAGVVLAAAGPWRGVRAKGPPVDLGRVALPRGTMAAVRREKRMGRFRAEPLEG